MLSVLHQINRLQIPHRPTSEPVVNEDGYRNLVHLQPPPSTEESPISHKKSSTKSSPITPIRQLHTKMPPHCYPWLIRVGASINRRQNSPPVYFSPITRLSTPSVHLSLILLDKSLLFALTVLPRSSNSAKNGSRDTSVAACVTLVFIAKSPNKEPYETTISPKNNSQPSNSISLKNIIPLKSVPLVHPDKIPPLQAPQPPRPPPSTTTTHNE